jgi:hypothetical protein
MLRFDGGVETDVAGHLLAWRRLRMPVRRDASD